MKRKTWFLLVPIAFMVMMQGCYYDNEEELYPETDCVAQDVSFQLDVVPILRNACYNCHDLANAPVLGNGINIEGYERMKAYTQNNTNKMVGSLKWNGQASPMPKNAPQLDNCSIAVIEAWISDGYQNN